MIVSLMSLLVALLLAALPSMPARAASPTPAREATTSTAVGVVNINTADVKQLTSLDGVGRSLAEKIVQHRQANGSFQKPEDIRKVKGVGKGIWERNKDRIVVR